MTLAEQMGNVGSEVYRAIRAKQQTNQPRFQLALERMLELLDLTIADPRWMNGRRELLRAREVLCDFLVGDNVYRSTPQNLQSYFDHFALAARRQAGRA
ncbi:MAG: hypothetical protein AAB619_00845 [Patescibacteria group bacterium]